MISDEFLYNNGFVTTAVLSQLFYITGRNICIVAALVRIASDFLFCGESDTVDSVVSTISRYPVFGSIVHRPGVVRYVRLNISQYDDNSVSIGSDDKLKSLPFASITRVRCRDVPKILFPTERIAFASIDCFVGWLESTASPFLALFSSIF